MGVSVCYESEITNIFLEELKRIYQLDNLKDLYSYFVLRYLCSNMDRYNGVNESDINFLEDITLIRRYIDFLLSELDIITQDETFIYKGEIIHKYISTSNNTMLNVISEINYECLGLVENKEFFLDIKKKYSRIKSSAKRKSATKKHSVNYMYYVKYYALDNLNKMYGIKEVIDAQINNKFNFNQDLMLVKLEDQYIRYMELDDSFIVSEDALEKYFYKNLDKIEHGLKYIKRQYAIKEGIIDILAKDKDGLYTIIELKVCNDEDVIMQSIYYPKQLMSELKVDNVRMIVISTEYSYRILESLRESSKLNNLKAYVCNVKSKGSKIKRISDVDLYQVV